MRTVSQAIRTMEGRQQDPLISDGGFDSSSDFADLGADNVDAPPAYSDQMNQIQMNQSGFEAGATVAEDGRVNININQTTHRFADLLAPALRTQVLPLPEKKKAQGPLPPPYIPPSLGGQPGQTPPPRLNVVIQIVGSRGDVQPFVALGQVLRDTYGHRVRLATHPTFQKFVEDAGLEFFSIGGDPAELMAFMVKNPGLMPGFDALTNGEITKRRKGIEEIVVGCWRSCIEAGDGLGPPPPTHKPGAAVDEGYVLPGSPTDRPFVADAIIANPPSFAHIHVAEKLGVPLHIMFTMPWNPTKAFPHPLANIQSSNAEVAMTNFMSYAMVEMMTWQGLGDVINRFREKILDLDPLSLIWAPGMLTRLRVPTTYCWSPALIPKPNDWGPEISIAGFYFLNLASNYTPEPDLADFLAAGPPPVYIGFGSIVVDDPDHLTSMIFDAVRSTGIRALVSKGWGGLGADSMGIPEGVFMLGNCPHDWLFKHVSAVVHHGGAGTSAAGINLGVPTVVVPFFGDQPFWGAMIARAGAGPEPIPYSKLTAENLAGAITEALKPETQARAKELGAKIREERGTDEGGKFFHDHLEVNSLRCSLAPSRVAVWRVRRSQVRLSGLAAAVLVAEGKLKYGDLKLFRATEYSTEEQPWDPISAVTSALVGDLSGIAMAVADFPREVFKGARKKATSNAGVTPTPSSESLPQPGQSSGGDAASIASGSTGRQGQTSVSDIASISSPSSTQPSVTVSGAEGPSNTSSTNITSPDRPGTPNTDRPRSASSPRPKSPFTTSFFNTSTKDLKDKAPFEGAPGLTLDNAAGAGRGVTRIVQTGMRTPMNFCMGLARGFRNAPRLYNDETLRPTEKVTGMASGAKIASKELGIQLFDGITGLATQPWKGAQKEGGKGLAKGFGKGVAGLVLKGGAAIWGVPAYLMAGVNAEVRGFFARSMMNYVVTSRVLLGREDEREATAEEKADVVKRWNAVYREDTLKGFKSWKSRDRKSSDEIIEEDYSEDRPGTGAKVGAGEKDLELEKAIRESVRQTSRGNDREDKLVETQIRASISEMQRISGADFKTDIKRKPVGSSAGSSSSKPAAPLLPPRLGGPEAGADDAALDITEEEYLALIEEAVRQSLASGPSGTDGGSPPGYDDDEDLKRAIEASRSSTHDSKAPLPTDGTTFDEEALRRAMAESSLDTTQLERRLDDADAEDREQLARVLRESRLFAQGNRSGEGAGAADEDDEELRRVLEESEKQEADRAAKDKAEDEIVMEFVRRQSLMEEEFRKNKDKGKGKEKEGGIREEE